MIEKTSPTTIKSATHLALAALLILGCAQDPDPKTDTERNLPPPVEPDSYDPKRVVTRKTWHLVGNDTTPGDTTLRASMRPPEGSRYVDAWIDGQYAGRYPVEDGIAQIQAPLGGIPPGTHQVLVSGDGSDIAIATFDFIVSHPLYVFVTNDWDDPDNTAAQYELQERLHNDHPHLIMTHFVGPYAFTDNTVSANRRRFIAEWLQSMRDDFGDEIGLHIHPYCSFVETTSIECRTAPTFGTKSKDSTGYTVILASYTKAETETLLGRAIEIFNENGLGTPTSFRAGGWTAEIHTLEALVSTGFVADTSANNWQHIEEWRPHPARLYPWNKRTWSAIGDTSQPYYPSLTDMLKSDGPSVGILEVPDNGSLADYVTTAEMVEILEANWTGGHLEIPTSLVVGYHPTTIDHADYFERIDGALDHFDQHLYLDDDGPIIYELMSATPRIWPED